MKFNLLCLVAYLLISSFHMVYGQEGEARTRAPVKNGYAPVNGLEMYYEIHGNGEPIILLHGAYMTIEGPFRDMMNRLSSKRKVIAVELQGHGRTADIDRPITYEQMADDVAEFLNYLEVDSTDVYGYSMGGGVALQIAIRHPQKVKKLIVASATYKSEGMHPSLLKMIANITPEQMAKTPYKKMYDTLAPNPNDFPVLVEKLKTLDETPQDWPAASIKAIQSPTMLILGDADAVTPEHAVEMFRLLGGGVMGDLAGLPNARLAVLPGTTHVGVMNRLDWTLPMIKSFLKKSGKNIK